MTPLRLLLTLSLLLLTSCIAPDGQTYTVATVDEERRVQVQRVDVDAEQEFYRGFWLMCLYASAAQSSDDTGDLAGCNEVTALAHAHDAHLDGSLSEYWNFDLVKQ